MVSLSAEPTAAVPGVARAAQPRQLHKRWAVYYTQRVQRGASYASQLQRVCTLQAFEELAYVYSRLVRPSQLPPGTSVYFVNDQLGKKPLWENSVNGGTFQYRVYTDKTTQYQTIDRLWERTLFAVLGETIQEPAISAVQVTAREGSAQISVWNFEALNRRTYSRTQLKLGDVFECSVHDFEYVTNRDSLRAKRELADGDTRRAQAREAVRVEVAPPEREFHVVVRGQRGRRK